MDAKKIALLVGALIVAAVCAFMVNNMISGRSAPSATAAAMPEQMKDGPQILVATRSLPVGTIVGADSFRFQPWPSELIENAYYKKGDTDPNSLNGTVVRTAVSAGQPMTMGSLVKPGDRGFLAAALGPGMRAVTVDVTQSSGNAGWIFPGDRVDVVVSQTIDGSDGPPLRTSETFARNVRVLATDQRMNTEDAEGKTEVKVFQTVTLEVTPRIAEKVSVAKEFGKISLSLRSIAENAAELERAIAAGEVSVPEGVDPKKEKEMLLAIASRPTDTGGSFVTGADVSRFQRRSVPRQNSASAAPAGAAPATADPAVARAAGPVVRVWRSTKTDNVEMGGK